MSTKRLPKLTNRHRHIVALLVIIAIGTWQLIANECNKHTTHATDFTVPDVNLLLEVTTDSTIPQQIIDYTGMRVSFNPKLHIPNWVAWELTADETNGKTPRTNKFYKDERIEGCPETYDYNYSGFDRGHMAPAGDMKWDRQAMLETFYMTNICPQAKVLNTGSWKRLEEKCRQWAKADSAIIIICGPVTNNPIREYFGDSRVAVPKRFFKVILSPYAYPPRGIGFLMPNDKVPGGIQAAAVSIDEIERVTGLDFFSALPDEVEREVESQCDFHYWSTIR